MDMWCGEKHATAAGRTDGCIVNTVLMLPGLVLMLLGTPLYLLTWCRHRSPCDVTRERLWVRYPGHSLRWAVTFLLGYIQLLELLEGVLMQVMMSTSPQLHLCIPAVVCLLAYAVSLLFYNITETFNLPRWLLTGLLFWLGQSAVRVAKVMVLYDLGVTSSHVRLVLAWLLLALTLVLLTIDVYLLLSQKYLCGRVQQGSMDEELQHLTYVHPYTNFLSHATWNWLTTLLRHGYHKPLEMLDLGKLPKTESSELNFKNFKRIFEDEKMQASRKKGTLSLWRCYMRAYWPMLFLAGIYRLIADFMIFVGPICLDGIVNFVIDSTQASSINANANATQSHDDIKGLTHVEYFYNGYILAFIALCSSLIQGTCLQNSFYLCVRQGIRLKGALQSLVYEKTMRLSLYSLGEGQLTQGQVINHMAVDPMHLFSLFYFGHFIWSLPLEVILTFVMLYIQLGVSALVSAGLLLLLVPAQYYIGRILATTQKAALEEADVRLKKSNELLQSIKLLKLYAWEAIFSQSITETRRRELKLLLKAAFMRVLSIFITDGAPVASTMLTFVLYPYIEEKPLKAAKVFSCLALFNILGLPLYLVTLIINIMTHAKVSTDRLTSFFMAPEIEGTTEGERPLHTSDTINQCPEVLIKSPKRNLSDMKDNKHDLSSEQPLLENGYAKTNNDSTEKSSSLNKHNIKPQNVLEVTEGNFAWDVSGRELILKDINFVIPEGELTIVIGTVGSGKTSLLSAVLGEMTTVSGHVLWNREKKIAYGGQKAWLLNATVQENILFGRPLDNDRYEKMLDICALRLDLDTLSAGDQTEIGEKGINLSGGQKQRISIARTIYSDADIIILDDPLSALDVHVGSHIFQSAIQEYLREQGKTVILVTHHLHYLTHARQVLHLENGRIAHQGSLSEIELHNPDIAKQWSSIIQHNRDVAGSVVESEGCPAIEIKPVTPSSFSPGREQVEVAPRIGLSVYSLDYLGLHKDLDSSIQLSRSRGSIVSAHFPAIDHGQLLDKGKTGNIQEVGKLIQEEEHSTGSVKFGVYTTYLKHATVSLSFMAVFCYSVRQALRMGTDYWLAEWAEASEASTKHTAAAQALNASMVSDPALLTYLFTTLVPSLTTEDTVSYVLEYYLMVFVWLCVAGILLTLISIIFLELMCLNAARNLHDSMLSTIVMAPMRFFDTTPLGRIVNRMSGDINIIDEKMAVTGDGVLFTVLYVMGGIIMNAVSTPFFLIPAFPLVAVYFIIQRFFISSSRELQRLDSITKSPILSHFSETLNGLSTIRAFRDQSRFRRRNWKNIDKNNTAFLYLHTANVWMGIRLDYLGACIVFTAAVCSITSGLYGFVSPGIVGLAIAYALMISGFVNWMMRTVSEAEMYFTSVERISHFAKLKTEPMSWDAKDEGIPSDWPKRGEIEFENVSLTYDAALDPVIHGINLTIKAGEKVGICGRTGSGKSSLTLGLFRMIDICGGKILIDGVDVCHVGLHHLRAKLSIIPQDPVMFEGSIRFNLDPQNKSDDSELWEALEIAQLKTLISSLPEQLNSPVTEGGENFSIGQRQLVCIARALLRHSQILIMDEATASIDMSTDSIIQRVIQTAFKDKTVITIAHRVATILRCDRIVVLSDGQIMEHDSPQNLLANPDSMFASLVRENK